MSREEQVLHEYAELLGQQDINPDELNYSVLNHHITFLEQLDVTGTSCISIFDMYKRQHIYMSEGYHNILGFDKNLVKHHPEQIHTEARTHPDDRLEMAMAGIHFLKIAFELPIIERKRSKLIADYRVLNKKDEYIRVVEQFQALELDSKGNVWLALCFLDISPSQDIENPFRCKAVNYATNEIMSWVNPDKKELQKLSSREKEILGMIASGMMSKEIAEKLYISIHTVNTHRQRILEKLDVNNSIEAIRYARGLGLV
ncbi:MAG: helix-turn-helix transcriptional regulator [Bacteroidales bacterium]|nr:helix-turn-helix transcriptional regulator [Bacteroidales bacterium]